MITSAESVIVGSGITAAGWALAARWQHRGAKTSERIEGVLAEQTKDLKEQTDDLKELKQALISHTNDDDRRFAEVRALLPQRRRGWLLPALGLCMRFFL